MDDVAARSDSVDIDNLIERSPISSIQVITFVLCGMVALLDGADTQSFALAAASIAGTFHMKVTEFGPAFAVAHLGACCGAMICGSLSDAVGRKAVLVGATLTFGVFTVATALASTYNALLVIRLCAGLGLGSAVPCFLALASEYAPASRRGTLASVLWAAFPLGGMLGGFANSFIITHYGWTTMFYLGGGLPLVVAFAMAVLMLESPIFLAARANGSLQLRAIAERIGKRSFAAGTTFFTTERKERKLPIGELFARKRGAVTLALWGAFFGAFGLLTLVVSWVPALLHSIGLPPAGAATVLGFFNLGAVIGMGAAGHLVDRIDMVRALGPVLSLSAVAVWLLGHVQSVGEASAVMASVGLLLGCGASGLIAIASTFYETRMRATGIGWGMAMGRFGQFLGPLLTGAMLVRGFAIGEVMHVLAVVPIGVALAVLWARFSTRRAMLTS